MSAPKHTTDPSLRRCSKCDSEFPATTEFFYRHKMGKGGLRSTCKTCNSVETIAYVKEHPERNRQKVRDWRKANPEKRRVQSLRGYYQNHEKYLDNGKKWRKANPQRVKNYVQQRNARKQNLPDTFTEQDWQRALDYFDGRCAYCGNQQGLFNTMRLHQDHVIPISDPRSDNPGYVPSNIVPACMACNDSKWNRDVKEWLAWKFGKRKARIIIERIDAYKEWLEAD